MKGALYQTWIEPQFADLGGGFQSGAIALNGIVLHRVCGGSGIPLIPRIRAGLVRTSSIPALRKPVLKDFDPVRGGARVIRRKAL
jgi:hypothetical protein